LLSRDPEANKLRDKLEFWFIPMMNPDGIVCGNYRCNTQGKDMNRSFYPDNDSEAPMRIIEVELLRSFMEENFNPKKQE
jgi:murein tripeptide amidase MpaA